MTRQALKMVVATLVLLVFGFLVSPRAEAGVRGNSYRVDVNYREPFEDCYQFFWDGTWQAQGGRFTGEYTEFDLFLVSTWSGRLETTDEPLFFGFTVGSAINFGMILGNDFTIGSFSGTIGTCGSSEAAATRNIYGAP